MTVNIDTAITYMYSLKDKNVKYSMTGSRTGADGTADCSGALYQGLRNAGATNAGWILNTDSMHTWLEKNGFKLIASNKTWSMKRGDIIIFGKKGSSGGAAGHVVIAIDSINVIHCNYPANGVSVNKESTLPYSMGWYVYRLDGTTPSKTPSKPASTNSSSLKWVNENGTFTSNTVINLRKSVPKGAVMAVLPKGSKLKYDSYAITSDKMVWIRQPRANGTYGYLATGYSGGKRWGTFK